MAPFPQVVEVVVWLGPGAITTGAGTCTTGGDTATTGAGTGTVSTSFVLEKHPERIPLTASDKINDEQGTDERIVLPPLSLPFKKEQISHHLVIHQFTDPMRLLSIQHDVPIT
jgi:hypothetical protein